MPRLLASMTRFSIWSDMPSPCRPPMALASSTRSTAEANSLPLIVTGRPCSNPMVTSSAAMSTAGSQHRTGDRPPERGGVEVGTATRADVERPARQRRQPLLHQGRTAVHQPRDLRAVRGGPTRHRPDVRLVVLAYVRGVRARDRPLLA